MTTVGDGLRLSSIELSKLAVTNAFVARMW